MTRLLLDTHTLVWYYLDDPKLSSRAKAVIENIANPCYVSSVTLWEVALLTAKGRLPWKRPLAQEIELMLKGCDATVLQIGIAHVVSVASLVRSHKDPFDRMLVAQAATEGLTLVTRDKALAQYRITTYW